MSDSKKRPNAIEGTFYAKQISLHSRRQEPSIKEGLKLENIKWQSKGSHVSINDYAKQF